MHNLRGMRAGAINCRPHVKSAKTPLKYAKALKGSRFSAGIHPLKLWWCAAALSPQPRPGIRRLRRA